MLRSDQFAARFSDVLAMGLTAVVAALIALANA